MSDVLRMDYINSLPQPFLAKLLGGSEYEVIDIDVQTGLLRINVSGMMQVIEMPDVKSFKDMSGKEHDPDTFYTDFEG